MLHGPLTRRAFTADEYNRMGEVGILGPEDRVELIDGEVIRMTPHDPLHSEGVERCNEMLVATFARTHRVRPQLPISASEVSEPEPDFALVAREPRRRWRRHPDGADLVVEVASTSLGYDRTVKASLYASLGVPEYWILNLADRRLEVLRDPRPDPHARFGWDYATRSEVDEHGRVTSLLGGPPLAVASLLPEAG